MSVEQKLLKMVDGLNMPLNVSSKDGSIRVMQERIRQIREGLVQSYGSCQPPYSSWGN